MPKLLGLSIGSHNQDPWPQIESLIPNLLKFGDKGFTKKKIEACL